MEIGEAEEDELKGWGNGGLGLFKNTVSQKATSCYLPYGHSKLTIGKDNVARAVSPLNQFQSPSFTEQKKKKKQWMADIWFQTVSFCLKAPIPSAV